MPTMKGHRMETYVFSPHTHLEEFLCKAQDMENKGWAVQAVPNWRQQPNAVYVTIYFVKLEAYPEDEPDADA